MSDHMIAQGVVAGNSRPRRHDRKSASKYLFTTHGLRYSPNTLAKLACIGGGPEFRKAGRAVVYEEPGLDGWAEERIGPPQKSTSDTGGEA
jgi:hypothetical protein